MNEASSASGHVRDALPVEGKTPVGETVTGATDHPLNLSETVTRLTDANEQLKGALESRVVIEQAKGVLAERFSLSLDEAFALLRDAARSSRTGLRALAKAVVSEDDGTPDVVLGALTRPERWSRRQDGASTRP